MANTTRYSDLTSLINSVNEVSGIAKTQYVDDAIKNSMKTLEEAGLLGESLYVNTDGVLKCGTKEYYPHTICRPVLYGNGNLIDRPNTLTTKTAVNASDQAVYYWSDPNGGNAKDSVVSSPYSNRATLINNQPLLYINNEENVLTVEQYFAAGGTMSDQWLLYEIVYRKTDII